MASGGRREEIPTLRISYELLIERSKRFERQSVELAGRGNGSKDDGERMKKQDGAEAEPIDGSQCGGVLQLKPTKRGNKREKDAEKRSSDDSGGRKNSQGIIQVDPAVLQQAVGGIRRQKRDSHSDDKQEAVGNKRRGSGTVEVSDLMGRFNQCRKEIEKMLSRWHGGIPEMHLIIEKW